MIGFVVVVALCVAYLAGLLVGLRDPLGHFRCPSCKATIDVVKDREDFPDRSGRPLAPPPLPPGSPPPPRPSR